MVFTLSKSLCFSLCLFFLHFLFSSLYVLLLGLLLDKLNRLSSSVNSTELLFMCIHGKQYHICDTGANFFEKRCRLRKTNKRTRSCTLPAPAPTRPRQQASSARTASTLHRPSSPYQEWSTTAPTVSPGGFECETALRVWCVRLEFLGIGRRPICVRLPLWCLGQLTLQDLNTDARHHLHKPGPSVRMQQAHSVLLVRFQGIHRNVVNLLKQKHRGYMSVAL